MLQAPALVLSLLLASVYAAVFHMWQGRDLRDLAAFWLAAVFGFGAGQLMGSMLGFLPWTLGQVRIIEATLGAFLFLVIARWLRQEKEPPRP
jgi:hypothetical protein